MDTKNTIRSMQSFEELLKSGLKYCLKKRDIFEHDGYFLSCSPFFGIIYAAYDFFFRIKS